MRSGYLVCYDIREERRLSRVYGCLKRRGVHVQYSVFFCRLTWAELLQLKHLLRELISEREDDLRIYPLPAGFKTIILGRGDRVPDGVMVMLP